MQLLGSQRHPHDFAVRGSHPAGFAARIPPGPPECWPLTSAARGLAFPKDIPGAGLPAICQALESTRHLLEMYRRQLRDENGRPHITAPRQSASALSASQLQRIHTEEETPEKTATDWPVNRRRLPPRAFRRLHFLWKRLVECGEQELNHSDGQAEKFYRDLKQRGISVRVGMEATGYSRWFERLLAVRGGSRFFRMAESIAKIPAIPMGI